MFKKESVKQDRDDDGRRGGGANRVRLLVVACLSKRVEGRYKTL